MILEARCYIPARWCVEDVPPELILSAKLLTTLCRRALVRLQSGVESLMSLFSVAWAFSTFLLNDGPLHSRSCRVDGEMTLGKIRIGMSSLGHRLATPFSVRFAFFV